MYRNNIIYIYIYIQITQQKGTQIYLGYLGLDQNFRPCKDCSKSNPGPWFHPTSYGHHSNRVTRRDIILLKRILSSWATVTVCTSTLMLVVDVFWVCFMIFTRNHLLSIPQKESPFTSIDLQYSSN